MASKLLASETEAARLDLVGGELCLDFTNTISNHSSPEASEHLTSYRALVEWSQHAGILSDRTAQRLLKQAARDPAQAQRILDRAIELREALHRVFSLSIDRKPLKSDYLDTLNKCLTDALLHSGVVHAEDGFAWGWIGPEDALEQMLWSVARSAVDLITSEKLERLQECGGDDCGWLFIDTSKNHSRRWCSMSDCGNRAKVRRYYERRRTEA